MISGCMSATAVQERPLKGTKKIGHSDTGRCIPSHIGTPALSGAIQSAG